MSIQYAPLTKTKRLVREIQEDYDCTQKEAIEKMAKSSRKAVSTISAYVYNGQPYDNYRLMCIVYLAFDPGD